MKKYKVEMAVSCTDDRWAALEVEVEIRSILNDRSRRLVVSKVRAEKIEKGEA